jgi:HAD superfamily hydrolase (TIGR01509 family)
MEKKLIIFDCDGVLVDSEFVASRVFSEALSSYGYPISTEESIKRFTGISDEAARQMILKESTVTIPEDYWLLQQSALHKAYEMELTSLMQPVLELLLGLNFPRCVASNSSKGHVRSCLKITNQLDYFSENTIFSAEQVKKPKPAPDLFLFAAKNMGYNPEDCIVVEDSQAGTEAAIHAGMDVMIFLGGTHTKSDWYKSNIEFYKKPIFETSEELASAITKKIMY